MKKQDKKVTELIENGYKLISWSDVRLNNRNYKVANLEKDGHFVSVNSRGGIGGLASNF